MIRNTIRMAMLAAAFISALPAWADYEAGQAARGDAGHLDEAVTRWRAAADAGDRRAMLALGQRYLQGLGVLQDYVEAHMWFNLAASRGEAAAVSERDALSEKMTPAQVAEAQALARAWLPGAQEGADAPSPADALASTSASTAIATTATAAPDTGPPSDPDRPPPRAIREAQDLLGALGYAPGPADGVWGQRSLRAYQSFLRDAGLPSAEVLTPEALRVMRAFAKRRDVDATAARDASQGASRTNAPRRAAVRPDTLHRTAQAGDVDGLKAALEAGVDVNARDSRGWTALMHVVNKGYTLLVEPLLDAKADPNIRAADGATALFMAAVHGHSEIIALLMQAGADLSVRGPTGKAAVDVALIRGDPAILKALGIPQVRDVFRDCEDCPEMVVVPSGTFTMGSPKHEKYRNEDEGPQHRVTIAQPFAVGVYEVTFEEWDACRRSQGCTGNPDDEGWGRGRRPVINVSWHDAQRYVRWLSEKTAHEYRLLSESEWEYAARAGTSGPYHTGSKLSINQANFDDEYHRQGSRYGERTVPVGSFSANAFGVHNVHGNVWEWVQDCWHESYGGAPTDGSSWESGNCRIRVLRGGNFENTSSIARSAFRHKGPAGLRLYSLGFRVARTLSP